MMPIERWKLEISGIIVLDFEVYLSTHICQEVTYNVQGYCS
jgi:hypothetical protein